MAQMHADGSWVPRQRSQTQHSVQPAACGGGLRPICAHQRHPLLICVESCLLWRRLRRPSCEFQKIAAIREDLPVSQYRENSTIDPW
jgi:hypothetical protein